MNWYLSVLKKYAVFKGRARRTEYWMFVLVNCIITVILYLLAAIPSIVSIVAIDRPSAISGFFIIVLWIYALAVLIPGLAVSVRRLHDTNRSGFFLFMSLIPLAGPIILLVFLVQEGVSGDNQYGPDPKEPIQAEPSTAT
jgi:uncharacterized membrane protein YhaH (DUF805 family)